MVRNYPIRKCAHCTTPFKPNNPNHRFCSTSCHFWSKVDICGPSECWEWLGPKVPKGYGHFSIKWTKDAIAHRFAWSDSRGPIPSELNVLHDCDNRACCNPAHLWLGTQYDNIHDMIKKNRANHAKGITVNTAKLSEDDVLHIRDQLKEGVLQKILASQYDVSIAAISAIKCRKTWAYLR